jgi:hypothetical protein
MEIELNKINNYLKGRKIYDINCRTSGIKRQQLCILICRLFDEPFFDEPFFDDWESGIHFN